jgi:hypothetical protein
MFEYMPGVDHECLSQHPNIGTLVKHRVPGVIDLFVDFRAGKLWYKRRERKGASEA